MDVQIPAEIRAWADAVAAHGGSAILFGSHAQGCARTDSDWDLAVIGDAGLARVPFRTQLPAQVVHIEPARFIANANVYPGLPFEVVRDGIALSGDIGVEELRCKEVRVDRSKVSVEFMTHATSSVFAATRFVEMVAEEDLWEGEWPRVNRRAVWALPSDSAMAAERAAKALCVATGRGYTRTHDLAVLANEVPAEWREKVLALDGVTAFDHMAGYEGAGSTCESCRQRVLGSLRLLESLIGREPPLNADDVATMRAGFEGCRTTVEGLLNAHPAQPLLLAVEATAKRWLRRLSDGQREVPATP